MPEVEVISWKDLTGNKYSRNLHPAMVSNAGYVAMSKIRRIGDIAPTPFNVIYDRDYLLEYAGRNICKPLYVLGKKKTLELVSEAWDKMYPNYQEEKPLKKEAS